MKLYNFFKRIFDFIVALVAVVVLAPFFLILIIIIRRDSPGPAIFKQERAGKGGKPFVFYKFRTMKLDVEPFGPSPKSESDRRFTKSGKAIREYSLDELPQLFNVLKGDMSIVGPTVVHLTDG